MKPKKTEKQTNDRENKLIIIIIIIIIEYWPDRIFYGFTA